MQYIVCETPGKFSLADKEQPVPESGEVQLKIHQVGICGTDLHAFSGNQAFFTYPRILGHELAAVVTEVAEDVHTVSPGEQVVVMPYLSCGQCVACEQGKTNCCTRIQVLGVHCDGGMQEYICVPASIVMPVPGLSRDQTAVIEPLAIGGHAVRRADLREGETIAVVGCGPIGLGLMFLAKYHGARVIAMDINPQRLTLAQEYFGADATVNVSDRPVEQVRELTDGKMAAAVFDASGNKRALESGVDYMSHGGRYVLVGLSKGELVFQHPAIHAKESSILCSRNATRADFEEVIAVLKTGQFPIEQFVTNRVDFGEMIDHFPTWTDSANGVIKAMVVLDD